MRTDHRLPQDWIDFVQCLLAENVRFVIVGAFALAYHRTPRATGDIDFFIETSEDNAERLVRAIHRFGFGSLGLQPKDFLDPKGLLVLGVEPNRIDVLNWISGVTFEEAWEEKAYADLEGMQVPFLSLSMLIKNKIASNRPKDQDDIVQLQRAKEAQEKGNSPS